jgi:hypothetical protein
MKTSHCWSILVFVGLCLGAAGAHAQSHRDAQVLVPLARGVVAAPAQSDSVTDGEVIEDLPAVVAPRWSAEDEALASNATREYWLGLLSLCIGMAGALTLRRLSRRTEPRFSLPPTAGEGRISLV